MCVPPFRVSLSLLISFSLLFGRSEPLITIIEWNRYLSGIQPPFGVLFTTHLFSFHFRGADWKNLSQGLTEIWLSKRSAYPLSGFLSHFQPSVWLIGTNNQKDWLGCRYLRGIHILPSDFHSSSIPGPKNLLRYGNLSNVRTAPSEVLSHCISLLTELWIFELLSGSKAQFENWVRYRYLRTYSLSEFLSHRSSLFSPFCLDGLQNWPLEWTKIWSIGGYPQESYDREEKRREEKREKEKDRKETL